MHGEELRSNPLFLEYQVQGGNLPKLFGHFGLEVLCFVGPLRWFFAQKLDKFGGERRLSPIAKLPGCRPIRHELTQ
jgi:hypothetical protein